MKRALIIALWVVTSLAAISTTLAAVGGVTASVTAQPGATLATSSTSTTPGSTSTTILGSTTSTTLNGTTTTSLAPGSTTTEVPGSTTTTTIPGSTTSTTIPRSTTTTTIVVVTPETITYQLIGGWVRVNVGQGTLELDAAGPNPGFSMDIEKDETKRIRVRFESNDQRSELDVRWNDGRFEVDIDEDPDD